MNPDFKHMDTHGASQCKWCETPLSWINYAMTSVCSHCYDLMANSGLPESEIGGETDLPASNVMDAGA